MDERRKLALSHPRRAEILGFLAERTAGEGVGERELADAFAMSSRQVDYHLKVLQDANLVASLGSADRTDARQATYVATSGA